MKNNMITKLKWMLSLVSFLVVAQEMNAAKFISFNEMTSSNMQFEGVVVPVPGQGILVLNAEEAKSDIVHFTIPANRSQEDENDNASQSGAGARGGSSNVNNGNGGANAGNGAGPNPPNPPGGGGGGGFFRNILPAAMVAAPVAVKVAAAAAVVAGAALVVSQFGWMPVAAVAGTVGLMALGVPPVQAIAFTAALVLPASRQAIVGAASALMAVGGKIGSWFGWGAGAAAAAVVSPVADAASTVVSMVPATLIRDSGSVVSLSSSVGFAVAQ